MKPTIGRIVFVTLTAAMLSELNGGGGNNYSANEPIPAIITRVFGNSEGNLVNLKTIVDGNHPGHWLTSVPEAGTKVYDGPVWNWPPRV